MKKRLVLIGLYVFNTLAVFGFLYLMFLELFNQISMFGGASRPPLFDYEYLLLLVGYILVNLVVGRLILKGWQYFYWGLFYPLPLISLVLFVVNLM